MYYPWFHLPFSYGGVGGKISYL